MRKIFILTTFLSFTVIFGQEKTDSLTEVVAIGYGKAKKRDLTGSIVKIEGSAVADKPNANPVASLQGRVAGLSIVNSGRLGQEPDIRIRGTISRYQTKPLYVVDGIFSDNISYINSNDIESMEILKDPSSLAIFGVKGANGVIIVTTKQGKGGKLSINLNSSISAKSIVGKPKLADASLFKTLYNERLSNEGLAPFAYYNLYNGNTNWINEIANDAAVINNTNLSLTSGNEKNKIAFGLGYYTEDGLIKNEKLERITFNINNEIKFNKNFRIGFGLNGIKTKLPNEGDFSSALIATPIVDPYNSNGVYNQLPTQIGAAQIGNPLLQVNEILPKAIKDQYRFVGNIFAELKFMKNFTFKAAYYGNHENTKGRSYLPIVKVYAAETDQIVNYSGNNLTSVSQYQNTFQTFQQEYLLSYDRKFGDHTISATAGYTSFQEYFEGLNGSVKQKIGGDIIPDDRRFWYINTYPFGDPLTKVSNSEEWDRATTSYLVRLLYNYKGKYIINGSYRSDASSELPPNNRRKDFWSIGAAWEVTKEDFMKNITSLNYLKIKGSFGELGNQYSPVHYPYYPAYSEGATAIFGTPANAIPAYVSAFTPNANLTWESVKSWEVGIESAFLRNRLKFDATYYNKLTQDLLVYVTQGSNQYFTNAGEIENKGFELSASWNDKINEDFNYSFSGNLTTINNKVNAVFEDGYRIFEGAASVTEAGYPIGYFYGYVVDGLYQSYSDVLNSAPSTLGAYGPGDFKYKDVNGDGKITPDDRTEIGNPTPDFTYGFSTNVNYKNWFAGIDIQGVYGNEIYRNWGNGSSFAQFNYRAERENRWTAAGTSNWEPRLYDGSEYNRLPSTYMMEDGSYVRIRNIQLGYNFKPFDIENVKIQAMKLYVNVQNLYTWKHNSGFTPEAGGSPTQFSVDGGGYPNPVISTLGFSITF